MSKLHSKASFHIISAPEPGTSLVFTVFDFQSLSPSQCRSCARTYTEKDLSSWPFGGLTAFPLVSHSVTATYSNSHVLMPASSTASLTFSRPTLRAPVRPAGFATHPLPPTNSASFTCIPRSKFCQFSAATCAPVRHAASGSRLLEPTREPRGKTRRRCRCAFSTSAASDAGRSAPRVDSERFMRRCFGEVRSADAG